MLADAGAMMSEQPGDALLRGRALEREGRYLEAVDAYRQAVEEEPPGLEALAGLGSVLRLLGRDEEANEAFRLALERRIGGRQ